MTSRQKILGCLVIILVVGILAVKINSGSDLLKKIFRKLSVQAEHKEKKVKSKPNLKNNPVGMPIRKAVKLKTESASVAGEIKIALAKLKEVPENIVLLSTGIPFAPGQLKSVKDFVIVDSQGQEILIAVKELARWPQDQSVRSVLVQFKYKIEHLYEYAVLKWGVSRQTKDLEIIEPTWETPEGMIVMPAAWLCQSQVIGEQVPMGQSVSAQYDNNILSHFPELAAKPWSGNLREDGYYSTPHVFYQLFVRSGELQYFLAARKELLHYRDSQIVLEGEDRGRYVNDPEGRYVYVEALADDYLLTGDPKSLEVAGYMAEYLKKYLPTSKAFFPHDGRNFFTERYVAFPFLGAITYYELTQDKSYLKIADEYMANLYKTQLEWPSRGGFIHNLYAHDTEEGARPDEYGGSPFMTGLLLEPIIKYHQLTGSEMAADSIFRACDWLINEGLASSGKAFKYMTADSYDDEYGVSDVTLLIVHGLGYGYRLSGYAREDYLEAAMNTFDYAVNEAYLEKQKHFNQNYRSSGHFLAYISDALKYKMEHQGEKMVAAADQPLEDVNILYQETFDFAVGRFKSIGDADLKINGDQVYKNGSSLQVKSKFDAANLSAGVDLDNWNLPEFPLLNFSYMIPPGTPVGLRVQTIFGDWICLGGTSSAKCENPAIKEKKILVDDGQWHEASFNVKSDVQSLLSGVERLSGVGFYTFGNAMKSQVFWVDDVQIRK